MSAFVTGLGLACPGPPVAAREAARWAEGLARWRDGRARLWRALVRRSGVGQRHAVAHEAAMDGGFVPGPPGPSTARRMRLFERFAADLAERAARSALAGPGATNGAVEQLVTVSCTGLSAPGFDVELVRRLPLDPAVGRLHVGFMGCQGALNGLRAARAFAIEGRRVLLVAVELCSLHYSYGRDAEATVADALFGDGAAAVRIEADGGRDALEVVDCASWVFARDGGEGNAGGGERRAEPMAWRIGDHGFELRLSPRLPALLERRLAPWLGGWLAENGLAPADVGGWAVHPGGPRVLRAVQRSLGLPEAALDASREVLRERGNMSSATVWFVVDALRRRGAPGPWVALAFGPGLSGEAALLSPAGSGPRSWGRSPRR